MLQSTYRNTMMNKQRVEAFWLVLVSSVLYGLALPLQEEAVSHYLFALGVLGWLAMHWARLRNPKWSIHHPFAYPGFVLFTGLGALVWVDYAARGHSKHSSLGSEHLFSLGIAFLALGLSAWLGASILGWIARIWARFDRAFPQTEGQKWRKWRNALPWVILLLIAGWMLGLKWFVYHKNPPIISTESIRIVVCLFGAWIIYRWSFKAPHIKRALLALFGLVVIVMVSLWFIDLGQTMTLFWAGSCIVSALIALKSRLAGVITVVVLVVSAQWGVIQYGKNFGGHVSDRIAAIDSEKPYQGKLVYLSQIRWFLHTTPATGHGLANVPWCGTLRELQPEKRKAPCRGVPYETHSDYVFTALAGVWGLPAAIAITGLLAWWLMVLMPTIRPNPARVDSAVLAQNFGLIFIVLTLASLLMTCLGNIGIVILTGINFPFIGFGGTNLVVCAVCMGVLMNQPLEN
jgi:cell division protein FtsW (lipid II flippase)